MHPISSTLILAMSALALAMPAPQDNPGFFYEPVTLTFHGGPASYTLDLTADGNYYYTNNDLSVSLIDDNGFGAYEKCNFYSDEGPVFTRGVEHDDGNGTIAIGPPQPVYMVACQPTPGGSNTCLPVYSTCEWNGLDGTFLLNCCSGYCAATKCRPTS